MAIIQSGTGPVLLEVDDPAKAARVILYDTAGNPVNIAGSDGLTDAQLRATPVPISGSVSVDNFPVTQAVSGPLTNAELRAAAVPVDGSGVTQPVSIAGTVTVSGPLTDAALRASAVPVSGTFFQATQPVSAASLPLPSGASTEATLALIKAKTDNLDVALSTRTKPADQQHVIVDSGSITNVVHVDDNAGSLTVDGTVAISGSVAVTGPLTDTQLRASAVPVSGSGTFTVAPPAQTQVMKTGTLVTTAVTADQVILTYTVTAGKTFYLRYLSMDVRLTAVSATASVLGTNSLESPAGTKLITETNTNPTTSQTASTHYSFGEGLPFAAGTVIRVVCTPAATTSMTWIANFGGVEQ